MTKKDFKAIELPAIEYFVTPTEPEAPKVEKKGVDMPAVDKEASEKKEAKTKRLNLLLQPSLFEDLKKIALMQKTSVNDLVNTSLLNYRDAHKDLIEKYKKVFEE